MSSLNVFDEFIKKINSDSSLREQDKATVLRNLSTLKDTKVNILITGATGAGKSSTINALFNFDKAKVGTGVDPETMDIKKFELDNIILFDSPGLGDGKEADRKHAKNIINKLGCVDTFSLKK
ncbi:GTPase [Acinetobacter baumannii]|uniref:GTPase n=1 Tax=Acinetobacter baumannii TaxID=470 RepID=UPI00312C974D